MRVVGPQFAVGPQSAVSPQSVVTLQSRVLARGMIYVIDVAHALALVLERRTVSISDILPPAVLAIVLRQWRPERLEVVRPR